MPRLRMSRLQLMTLLISLASLSPSASNLLRNGWQNSSKRWRRLPSQWMRSAISSRHCGPLRCNCHASLELTPPRDSHRLCVWAQDAAGGPAPVRCVPRSPRLPRHPAAGGHSSRPVPSFPVNEPRCLRCAAPLASRPHGEESTPAERACLRHRSLQELRTEAPLAYLGNPMSNDQPALQQLQARSWGAAPAPVRARRLLSRARRHYASPPLLPGRRRPWRTR